MKIINEKGEMLETKVYVIIEYESGNVQLPIRELLRFIDVGCQSYTNLNTAFISNCTDSGKPVSE